MPFLVEGLCYFLERNQSGSLSGEEGGEEDLREVKRGESCWVYDRRIYFK